MARRARSAAATENRPGSVTTMTRSLAAQAVRVRALRDGAQSMSTRSYSLSIVARASSSFQTSRTLGCGPSKLMADGLPMSTSIVPGWTFAHPLEVIA